MAKEIYISSTPHETRLAIVEDEQLTEIYYERENEYTLAGSIYKGKVTRVLPGMQSAFVEVGLERDAFLYVTDFLEEQDEPAEFERAPQQRGQRRAESPATAADALPEGDSEIPSAPAAAPQERPAGEESGDGSRRLRGRRGRRRGRGGRRDGAAAGIPGAVAQGSAAQPSDAAEATEETESYTENSSEFELEPFDAIDTVEFEQESEQEDAPSIEAAAAPREQSPRSFEPRSDRGGDRGPRRDGERRPDRNQDRGSDRESRPTPIVLPGESLARFRGAQEPAAAAVETPQSEAAKPAPKTSSSSLKPSTLIDKPIEWDGGLLLPGESLSKLRNKPAAAPVAEPVAEPVSATQMVEEEWIEEVGLPESEAEQIEAAAAEEHAFEEVSADTESTTKETDASATHNVDTDPHRYFDLRSLFGKKKKPADKKKTGPAFTPGTGLVEEEFDEHDEGYDYSRIGAHGDDADADDLHEETIVSSGVISQLVRDIHIEERTDGDEVETAAARPARTGGRDGRGRRDGRGDRGGNRGGDRGGERSGERTGGDRGRRDNRGGGRRNMQSATMPVITELLKPGQEILVQIAKEPIAKKGARITSHIALPGRFLVFMPTVDHVGVSRRISSDEERQRLKRILLSEKGEASGGFIVRTAAEGASEEELRSDLRFLIHLWNDIKTRSDASKAPALIYHDLNLVERILRDQVSDNFSAIWVDTEAEYERVVRFMQRFQPSLVRHVKLYSKQTPLFEQFGISEEINKALKTKVWLKSGGSIVINQTEALVAIDINTGKYVGKTARLEDTIVKTNLDAIPEIVRQIRLRDLGGIIVIDFIDMDERRNRHKVLAALEEELKKDRAPSKVLQFNDFGLVAITRKRVKQSLERTLSTPCTTCTGTGMTKSPITVCNELYVELRKMHHGLEREDIMLRVHPEVVKELKGPQSHWLSDLEEMTGKTILVKSDPSLHPEQFDIQ